MILVGYPGYRGDGPDGTVRLPCTMRTPATVLQCFGPYTDDPHGAWPFYWDWWAPASWRASPPSGQILGGCIAAATSSPTQWKRMLLSALEVKYRKNRPGLQWWFDNHDHYRRERAKRVGARKERMRQARLRRTWEWWRLSRGVTVNPDEDRGAWHTWTPETNHAELTARI